MADEKKVASRFNRMYLEAAAIRHAVKVLLLTCEKIRLVPGGAEDWEALCDAEEKVAGIFGFESAKNEEGCTVYIRGPGEKPEGDDDEDEEDNQPAG
jgi:hypothetical protein